MKRGGIPGREGKLADHEASMISVKEREKKGGLGKLCSCKDIWVKVADSEDHDTKMVVATECKPDSHVN